MISNSTLLAEHKHFKIYTLSKEFAEEYSEDINKILVEIPLSESQTKEELLSDFKGERKLHEKWKHSLIAFDENQKVAGVVISSEREAEDNDLYPDNCIYLNSFAVGADFQKQGLGKFLLLTWLEYNKSKGFLELEGKLKFALQTNSAEWNLHVQKLYEELGFKKIGTKPYPNRVDNVYALEELE